MKNMTQSEIVKIQTSTFERNVMLNPTELRETLESRFPWLTANEVDVSGADVISELTDWHEELTMREVDESRLKDLVERAEAAGVVAGDLDDAIHDSTSGIGSSINNEGLESQIRYLCEEGSAHLVEEAVTAAKNRPRNAG
jgi:hypothetical protein